jgi:flagellar operon protein
VPEPVGIERIGRPDAPAAAGRPAPVTGRSFGDVLAERLQAPPVRFSAHAQQRLEKRGIVLDDGAMARLSEGVQRAAAKGSRSSLVVLDDTAFVVAVPNRTVITAVDREHMREQVFTNIDSAVIA